MLKNAIISAARIYFRFVPYRPPKEIRKVLVFTYPGIGDVLCSTPAIRGLAKKYGSVDVLCYPQTRAIFEYNKGVGKIYVGRTLKNLLKIRKAKYDMAVCYNLLSEPIYAYLAGIPMRRGKDINGFALTQHVIHIDGEYCIDEHVRIAGLSEHPGYQMDFVLPETVTVTPRYKFVIVPDAGMTKLARQKMWSAENFAAVANMLGEPVSILGNNREQAMELMNRLEVPYEDWTGISLKGFAAMIKQAKFVLCNDSAAMHVAACYDVPCLAVFGPTDPKLLVHKSTAFIEGVCSYGRRHCFHMDEAILLGCDKKCLYNIAPEQVVVAINKLRRG